MKEKILDVIIPAYNAHNKIFKTLCSIGNQSLLDKVNITIVNDAGDNYSKFIRKFKPHMDIREITLDTNGGPGVARQFGIDNTDCPYIYFMDADDVTGDRFCLEFMTREMTNNNYDMLVGAFLNEEINYETGESTMIPREKDSIWMHGKMYRRASLEKNHIRFRDDLRQNEDVYFNAQCFSRFDNIGFTDAICYMWLYYEDSITKTNNYTVYSYDGWFKAMYYHIEGCKPLINDPNYKHIDKNYYNQMACHCIVIGYLEYNSFIHLFNNDQQILNDFINFVVPVFRDIYLPLSQVEDLNSVLEIDYYNSLMTSEHRAYAQIPILSFNEFIDMLRERC